MVEQGIKTTPQAIPKILPIPAILIQTLFTIHLTATRAAAHLRLIGNAISNPQELRLCMALAGGLPEKAPTGKECHARRGDEDYRRMRG